MDECIFYCLTDVYLIKASIFFIGEGFVLQYTYLSENAWHWGSFSSRINTHLLLLFDR